MFIKLLLISIVIVGIAFLLLAVRMIIVRDGKFPNTSVGGNKKLRELGITCAKCEEQVKYNRLKKKKIKINPSDLQVIKN